MSTVVVWLNQEHAKLFHISEERMKREIVSDALLFDSVADKLGDTKRILILGPGAAKIHFLAWLKERYSALAQKVVGCESSDSSSDNQIAAYAMKYFKKTMA